MLCVHQNYQHGGALQPYPGREREAPWDAGDQVLRDMYEDNRHVILADARIDRGRKVVYNLPTFNIRTGLHEISDKLQEIFDDQQGAFKVAMSLGMILRNTETGECCYFAPSTNETVFPTLSLISKRHYLALYENKFRQLDLIEHMHRLRPNSKWRPFLLTNIRFDVFPQIFH